MEFLFGILGVICLVYYGVIVMYSGFETSFAPVWIVFAAGFIAAAVIAHFYGRIRDRVPLRLEVTAVTILGAFFVIFVVVEAAMGFHFFSLQKYSTDYAIVLGARVQGDRPGKSLEYRLEKALEYAKVHPNTIMILSGGQGEGELVSEAGLMYDYLLENGIPAYQMIKEENSHSTYENLVYSKLLIEAREKERRETLRKIMAEAGYLVPPDEEVTIRVAVITSNFHVMRAEGIAKKIGMGNVVGIAAKSDPVLFVHFCVRECFAILKDKFVGNM